MKQVIKKNGPIYQLGDYEISVDRDGDYEVRKYNRLMSYWELQMFINKKDLPHALRLLQYVVDDKESK